MYYSFYNEWFSNSQTDWEALLDSGLFTVVEELRYSDRVDGLLSFDDDAIGFLQKRFDFNKRPAYSAVTRDGRLLKITKDGSTLSQDIIIKGGLKKFTRIVRQKKRLMFYTAAARKADGRRYAGLREDCFLKNGAALWYPSFKRRLYFRVKEQRCYRFCLHSPKGEGPYPLIVFLHSAGAPGFDNIKQIAEVRNLWIRLKRQGRDCYILTPQLGYDELYNDGRHSESLWDMISLIMKENGNIDASRIYLAGISYGGHAAIYEAYRHPDRYAGAVPTVGWIYLEGEKQQVNFYRFKDDKYHSPFDDAGIEELAKTPLWLACSHIELEFNEPLYHKLKDAGADVRFTRNDRRGHHMHAAFFRKQPWDDWLFEKTKNRHPTV